MKPDRQDTPAQKGTRAAATFWEQQEPCPYAAGTKELSEWAEAYQTAIGAIRARVLGFLRLGASCQSIARVCPEGAARLAMQTIANDGALGIVLFIGARASDADKEKAVEEWEAFKSIEDYPGELILEVASYVGRGKDIPEKHPSRDGRPEGKWIRTCAVEFVSRFNHQLPDPKTPIEEQAASQLDAHAFIWWMFNRDAPRPELESKILTPEKGFNPKRGRN